MNYLIRFFEWYDRYARFFTYSWMVIVVYGSIVEILGAIRRNGTTFTDFVRAWLPQSPWWLRLIIVGGLCVVLFWHFFIQKANWVK